MVILILTYCYLIYHPYLDFANCLNEILYRIFLLTQSSCHFKSHFSGMAIHLLSSQHWHFLRVLVSDFTESFLIFLFFPHK